MTGRVLAGARQRLAGLLGGSRVLAPVRWLRRWRSAESGEVGETTRTSGRIRANSTVLRTLRRSRLAAGAAGGVATVRRARETSLLARLSRAGKRYAQGSWLYQWLTAEPEPEVVVIDLRETVTVGPWLAALERGLTWLLPAAASSALIGAGRRCQRFATSRPVQLASLLAGGVAAALLLAIAVSGTASAIFVAVLAVVALLAAVGSRIDWTWADLKQSRGFQALSTAFEPPEPPEEAFDSETNNDERTANTGEDSKRSSDGE